MKLTCMLVLFAVPAVVIGSGLEAWQLITHDTRIWNCVKNLDEKCVEELGKKPVEELFKARELKLTEHVFIEKIQNGSTQERKMSESVWDVSGLMKMGFEYLTNHALKLKLGPVEARLFQSPDKKDSLELTVEARRRDGGKSQRLYRVIIPLIIGFKITSLVIFGIVSVKLFLLKASLVANTALLVAGGIVVKKLYDHGMGMLSQHQALISSHHALPSYYANNHDFSGYGYNSFEGASSLQQPEVTDPVLGEPDHVGQFSHHAIALAALNKTLMQQQNQFQPHQIPKRRWGQKWSPWHSHR